MSTFQTDNQPTCDDRTIHLIIDAYDLDRTQRALLGRRPSSGDRIDFPCIEAYVRRWSQSLGRPQPRLEREYFDRERASARKDNPFFQVMTKAGYRLQLAADEPAALAAQLLARLEQLAQCRCPLFYVGGGHTAVVRQAILALSGQRAVGVAHFSRASRFGAQLALAAFDLVDQLGAAGAHYYADSADAESEPATGEPLLVLIDVENIDSALHYLLHGSVLSLNAQTRPSWTQLLERAAAGRGRSRVLAVAVLQDGEGVSSKGGFAADLRQRGYRPLLVQSEPGRAVVDQAIGKLLAEMQRRDGAVVLVSNDGGYYLALKALRALPNGGEREITVAGFVDQMSQEYRRADWIRTLDLERDLELFDYQLPNRQVAVAVDEFDAAALLDESRLFSQPVQGAVP